MTRVATSPPAADGAGARPAGGVRAYVGLGANLGDTDRTLDEALADLDGTAGIRVRTVSSRYRTAPVGYLDQPPFTNAVAAIDTTLSPTELLVALQRIESRHGRERSFRNAPRTLDLDLLLYGEAQIMTPTLVVPHPRLQERAFVVVPLAEIAPDVPIPGLGCAAALLPAVASQEVTRQ